MTFQWKTASLFVEITSHFFFSLSTFLKCNSDVNLFRSWKYRLALYSRNEKSITIISRAASGNEKYILLKYNIVLGKYFEWNYDRQRAGKEIAEMEKKAWELKMFQLCQAAKTKQMWGEISAVARKFIWHIVKRLRILLIDWYLKSRI